MHPWSLAPPVLLMLATAAGAGDWPHWRGPDRTGVVDEESGWISSEPWPAGEARWRTNVGAGAASPLVVDGRVYVIGWSDGRDTVRCLDARTGAVRWEQHYPAPEYGREATGDQALYRGVSATPEFDPDSGLLFTLGCDGTLGAWDTRDGGRPVWTLNLYERFEIPRRPQITERRGTRRDYGFTAAPMVWNEWLLVEAGDPVRGCLMAFPKRTGGDPVWTSENRDPAGHSGGMAPMLIDDVPCVAVATARHALVVRLDDDLAGKTVATFPWETDFANTIAGVAVEGRDLLISSRYNQMAMARVAIDLESGAREVWRNRFPTGVCTPVIHKGHIYFANRGVHCVDFQTGTLIWEGGRIGDAGSCIVTGDDRLIVWGNSGDLALIEGAGRSPDRCTILAEQRGVSNDMAWPHVVAADDLLLCKTLDGNLVCFPLPR